MIAARYDSLIRGVIFDLDNTLIATEEIAAQATREVLGDLGYSIKQEELDWMVGRRWDDIFAFITQSRKLNISSRELSNRIIGKKDEIFLEDPTILPGAVKAVRTCAALFPVGLVSGSFRSEIDCALKIMDVQECFSSIVGGDDCTKGKPHPQPYLVGAEKLGISPQEIAVFEDSEPGLKSAQAAGSICIIVMAGAAPRQDFSQANLVIPSLEKVDKKFFDSLQ